jgi:hypothetical protein
MGRSKKYLENFGEEINWKKMLRECQIRQEIVILIRTLRMELALISQAFVLAALNNINV